MTTFNHYIDTRFAALFLSNLGFKTAAATLNKLRSIGGGPEYVLFGRRPLYTQEALLAWAQGRTSVPKRSTSTPAEAPSTFACDKYIQD